MSPAPVLRTSALLILLATACGAPAAPPAAGPARSSPQPPIAAQRPHEVVSPFGTRVDPYYWLRDDTRSDPDVLGYLAAENAYTEAMLAPTQALQEQLYAEMIGRLQEDDTSVPSLRDGYWYYVRTEKGKQHGITCRRKGSQDAPEEVILDPNELGAGEAFYKVSGATVSPDTTKLAYVEDRVGRNQFRLRVKDLVTGELLATDRANVTPALAWASDGRTLFYVEQDPTTLRAFRVMRHVIDGGAPDEVVYEEADETFSVTVGVTTSERFISVASYSSTTTEVRLIEADRPTSAPRVFEARARDHLYDVDHLGGRFVIRTNWDAPNFRVMEVPDGGPTERARWRELLAHRDDAFVDAVSLLDDAIALDERSGGLLKVRVLPARGEPFVIAADDPAYVMGVAAQPEPSQPLRYWYESPTTPTTLYELDLATGERRMLKQMPVLGGFSPRDYVADYVQATAPDGQQVPVTIVRRRSTTVDGTAPLLIRGYGSYGISSDPWFIATNLSLLDRGWVVATAHVRGGQELGRRWYDDGRMMRKKNTFTDFIAVTEHLVAGGYGARDKVFATGGSAGGLLMGAIVNMRPDLYRGVVASVPFVDVVTTMLDDDIPLTTGEFDEWGNPGADRAAYDYMLSYSPYDNVTAQGYPSMLVTTGLWDSQVQYFEPAKWVAKLRATKTDDNLLLLHTDMAAGHGGKSGRYERYREIARDLAFMLHVLERPNARAPAGED